MAVDVIVFIVHGQSSCLSDCIGPYVDSFVLNGHIPEVIVLDSTGNPAEANAAKESLARVNRRHKLSVSFASAREHERYLRKVDFQALEYAIGAGSPEVGAMINMGLLATAGRSALFIDADTRFEMAAPRLVSDKTPPPIIRKFDLIGRLSSGAGVLRTGTWGMSCTESNGCFYKSSQCDVPPFIPSHGWGQGIPWLLMKHCVPNSPPTHIPLAVRKMSGSDSLGMTYVPLLDLIHGLVDAGSVDGAGGKLLSHFSEFNFSEELVSYANLLASWSECMDYARSMDGQGVKIAYKP